MKLPGTVPPKVQNVYVTPSAISRSTSLTSSSTMTLAGFVRFVAGGTSGGLVSTARTGSPCGGPKSPRSEPPVSCASARPDQPVKSATTGNNKSDLTFFIRGLRTDAARDISILTRSRNPVDRGIRVCAAYRHRPQKALREKGRENPERMMSAGNARDEEKCDERRSEADGAR